MDEIVYQREALRRQLLTLVDILADAAEKYDPESDFPVDDLAAALTAGAAQATISQYAKAIAERVQTRADQRKA